MNEVGGDVGGSSDMNMKEVKHLMKDVDLDGNGTVDLDEF